MRVLKVQLQVQTYRGTARDPGHILQLGIFPCYVGCVHVHTWSLVGYASSPNLCEVRRQAPRAPASPLSPEKRRPPPLGVSDALASATCGVFVPPFRVSDAGCQRQYGGQALYFFFQSCYRSCLVNTDDRAAPLSKCATQGPDVRTSSWSATQGATSLADFPGCAKSPDLKP